MCPGPPEAPISVLKKVLVHKTGNTFIQFIRYGIVGVIAFFVDFSTLYLLTLTKFFLHYYILATTIAFVFGLVTSYILSVAWVFPKRRVGNAKLEFLLFAVIGVIGLGLNAVLIFLFTEIVLVRWIAVSDKQLRIILSKIVATVLVYLWNFFARKFLLFR